MSGYRPKAGVVDQGTTNLVCRRHEFGMGHLRDPAACYLDSTLSEYRRLRPRQKRFLFFSSRFSSQDFPVKRDVEKQIFQTRCRTTSPTLTTSDIHYIQTSFQRPDRSLKADWLDERSTSNGAVRERVEPARLGGRWFGADSQPHGQSGSRGMTSCLPARREEVGAPPPDRPPPPPSPRDLQCCLKVRQVRHRAPPRYTKCACGRTLTDHRSPTPCAQNLVC